MKRFDERTKIFALIIARVRDWCKSMSDYLTEAKEKLKKEAAAGTFDRYATIMKKRTAEALEEFCTQSERFAEAVAHGGSFEECMKTVAKNVGNGISDFEAFGRAVKFYMKDAEVRFCMEITNGTAVPANGAEEKRAEVIDLSAFF